MKKTPPKVQSKTLTDILTELLINVFLGDA